GFNIGENFRVNENAGFAHQLNPAIAVNTCGNFIITWEDDRNDSWEIFLQRYHSDGTPVGSNFRVEDAIYGDYQLGPSVCMDDAGNFSVTWLDNRNEDLDIYCRRFNSEGNATGKSFRVNDDSGSSYQTSPCISTNQRGHFIITFTDYRNGNADVYAQQYLHDGTPYGYNFRIPDQCELEQSCSRVVLGDNRFYTTWHDNHTGQTGFDIWANAKDWDYWVGIGNSTPVETSPLPCLHQNYPNPFSQSTTIKFDLPEAAKVKIEICNHFGQKIETLLNKPMSPGSHEIEFVAGKLPGGVYLFRIASTSNLNAGEFQQVKRMVVLR
nr:hypothetical protein [Bacteroidota bacterium]